MTPRRPTRPIFVGDDRVGIVQIGGGLPRKGTAVIQSPAAQSPVARAARPCSSIPAPGEPTTPAPVSVQTMTAGYTHDIDRCVAEIHKLAAR